MSGRDTSRHWYLLLAGSRRIRLPPLLSVMPQPLGRAMVRPISAKAVDELYHFSWRKCCGLSFLHLPQLDCGLACHIGLG